jgi:hypothetical protein
MRMITMTHVTAYQVQLSAARLSFDPEVDIVGGYVVESILVSARHHRALSTNVDEGVTGTA